MPYDLFLREATQFRNVNTGAVRSATAPPPALGLSAVLNDQFTTLDSSRWLVYDNDTFGAPTRIQRYMAANAVATTGTAGSTGNTSLKMLSKREAVGGNAFTAAMMDSKGRGVYYPRYGRYEIRQKMPHGQGLWPAFWLTAKSGGADMCEVDIVEYFHSQIPGKTLWTLHRTDNGGTPRYNVAKNFGGTFFEAPTYSPGWHTMSVDILPWTGATATTGQAGDPNSPSTNVRFTGRLNGIVAWDYVDTQSLYWTTNAGGSDCFNIYVQGCQIGGNYVGHPDDPLGYSRWLNSCISGSGTAPNACPQSVGGYPIIRAQFGDPSSTYEIDYIKVWRYTG